jgi:N-acetylglucosamine-6-phosphate deacetylase
MTSVSCKQFFDGEILYGPHIITYDKNNNTITDLIPYNGKYYDYFLIAPGLVDIQMNGFDKWYVSSASEDEMLLLDKALAACGTTSWLATIITDKIDIMTTHIERISRMIKESSGLKGLKGLKGIHLEGPFLGQSPGAHPVEDIIPVDLNFIANLPDTVKLVTLAPEQINAEAGIKLLRKKGIVVSLGHSKPTSSEYESAVKAGATMITHLYNGMSGVSHRKGVEPGLALHGLTDDRMKVGLITDGIHVGPLAVKLAFRSKPSGNICIVSDTMPSDARFIQKDGANYLAESGILAGSCSPLSLGLKNAILSGVPLVEALKAVTSTPVKCLGGLERGVGYIRIGEKCDMTYFDEHFNVYR